MAITPQQIFHVGQLREVVKFERNVPSDSPTGGAFDGYVEFLVTRGRLRKLSGSRGNEAGEILLTSQYNLITRYQASLANELSGSGTVRIVCNNRFFTISSWEIQEERFRFFIFKLNEQTI